jgi:hypothetical protein
MVYGVQNKNLSNTFALIISIVVFLFLLFQVELDHHQHMSISISMDLILLNHLDCTNLAHITTYDKRLVLDFINYPNQTRAFSEGDRACHACARPHTPHPRGCACCAH